jgi:hypothetical protein
VAQTNRKEYILTFQAVGIWEALDEDGHLFRFVKAGKKIIGGVLKHKVKGTPEVDCEPGLVQWEPYGTVRPLFTLQNEPGDPVTLSPFVVCSICGDAGYIVGGKWLAKEDDEVDWFNVDGIPVLEGADDTYETAIRRDLGDKVPEEEVGADRRLYDMRGGPPVITSDQEVDPELEALLAEEEEIERRSQTPLRIDARDLEGNILSSPMSAPAMLQDSGKRKEYESGAMRDRPGGKGRYDQLQWMGLHRVALVLEKANIKYGDARNYEKGMPIHEYIDSAVRHIGQYVNGEDDEDHLAQATWNLLSALQTEELIKRGVLPSELDDRPIYQKEQ